MSNPLASASIFFNIQPGERKLTLLLFSWQMLFISGYYVLRPIRRGLVLDGLGNEWMPLIYLGTAVVTGLVVWVYSKFAHVNRRTLIGTIYGIFICNLIIWWQAFQFESTVLSGVFWIWLDVFSIMGVTLFWMYANDVFSSKSAKRLFGIVAGGGGLGAILGSSITAGLVERLGTTNMLLVAAAIVAGTLAIFLYLESSTSSSEPEKPAMERVGASSESGKAPQAMSKVIATIFSNRFLLFLTMLVCFERITPDIVQFLYNEVLLNMASGSSAIAALDANLERWRGIFEVCVELFIVAFVIRRLGTGFGLASNGLAIAGCLASFALFANPLIIVAIFHADEAMRHSWFKASKELTYTVTSREVLYTVKPVIEMFFYRFARGIAGILIYLVNTVAGLGATGVLAMGVFLGALWAYAGWQLNGEYKRRESLAKLLESPDGTEQKEKAAHLSLPDRQRADRD